MLACLYLSPYKYSSIFKRSYSSYLSAYEDGTDRCSETSAYKIRTPGNYPEVSIQHSEHGESLKSRRCNSVGIKNKPVMWRGQQYVTVAILAQRLYAITGCYLFYIPCA
jgi:hypothetical protein